SSGGEDLQEAGEKGGGVRAVESRKAASGGMFTAARAGRSDSTARRGVAEERREVWASGSFSFGSARLVR
ncbi:MAG: hypothetical protein SGPRY_012591, partial [Prymnesium sp.]